MTTLDTEDVVQRWGPTEFVVGHHVGLVGRSTIGLIEAGQAAVRDELWNLVAVDAPIDDVLDRLSTSGLKSLPAFGLAQVDGDSVRCVARGRTTIHVEFVDGSERDIDARDVRTWVEEAVAGVRTLSIELVLHDDDSRGNLESAPDRYVVLAGSVPASKLVRAFDVEHPLASAAESGWTSGRPESRAERTSESIRETEIERADDEMHLPHRGDVDEAHDRVAGAPTRTDEVPVDSNETIPAIDLDDLEAASAPASVDAEAGDYDFIFGHTVARSVEAAAVRADDNLGLISAVPVSAIESDDLPGTVVPALGDRDGLTISRKDLAVLRDARSSSNTSAGPHEVLATRCELGHVNPPQSSTCRNCGRPVLGDTPIVVPRPALGVLVFSNGERIVIDRHLLIGRNPRVGGTVTGELPRLVKFEGVGKGLSRTHAEVRLEGWQMLLEDLQSTNGTEVTLPGQTPRRLHAGEPAALVPGAKVDFGGEVQCVVEMVT